MLGGQRSRTEPDLVQGARLEFLLALKRLDYKHHIYNKIEDPHTRMVAAKCLEKERSELLRATYADNKDKIIARRKKRHAREGMGMTTHLYKEGGRTATRWREPTGCSSQNARTAEGTGPRRAWMPTPYCLPS